MEFFAERVYSALDASHTIPLYRYFIVSEWAHLYEEVQDRQWDDNHSKNWRSNQDDNDGTDHTEEGHEEGPQSSGHGLVNGVDILGESVEDAAEGRGVKEGHGRTENVA